MAGTTTPTKRANYKRYLLIIFIYLLLTAYSAYAEALFEPVASAHGGQVHEGVDSGEGRKRSASATRAAFGDSAGLCGRITAPL